MFKFETDTEHPVSIPFGNIKIDGLFHIPSDMQGIVLFAHGSGSSHLSPRNQYIARMLQKSKIATLLFDLLTPQEDEIDEHTMQFRFDIKLLAERLVAATDWVHQNQAFAEQSIGYFGASTGGGAALVAAAEEQGIVKAVVSRGGRPDLAGAALPIVSAATLLIVGGDDSVVLELNEQAWQQLNCVKKLEIVPGATHLFEEPGKLEEVGRLATNWFEKYL